MFFLEWLEKFLVRIDTSRKTKSFANAFMKMSTNKAQSLKDQLKEAGLEDAVDPLGSFDFSKVPQEKMGKAIAILARQQGIIK